MQHDLYPLINSFKTIRLEDMKQIAFNERVDTKFYFSIQLLPWFINEIQEAYNALSVENTIIQPYKTVYYDTESLQLYTDHHNGKLNRYKVRKRLYIANNISFSEIKFKSNRGITFKNRISTDQNLEELSEEDKKFVSCNTNIEACRLYPQSTNYFNRITLISKSNRERITLDTQLRFERNGIVVNLGNLVIAEVKKLKTEPKSLFEMKLKEIGIKSTSFSKYCTSIALIDQKIKINNFKENIRIFKKLNNAS